MNTEVATVETLPPAQPESETAAIMAIIDRAARDPAVDVDKLERLMQMRLDIELHAAKRAFEVALSEAQSEMETVRADSVNPQTRSRYASYQALDKAIRPIYTKHGFTVSYDTDPGAARENDLMVLAYVAREGYSRTYRIPMPADGKGAKGGEVMTRTHAVGSAFTYGKRYLLGAIFNIVVEHDDDGNRAGSRRPVARENVMRQPEPPPHDPETGEILDERASPGDQLGSPSAERPATSVSPSPSVAGSLDDFKMLDHQLAQAAEHGTEALKTAWKALTPKQQRTMEAALRRRHQPRAAFVDGEKANEQAAKT